MGSVFYPCFDLDNAEAVTLSGQAVTRETIRFTNKILNELINKNTDEEYVIAGDTDSVTGFTKLQIKRLKCRKITYKNTVTNEIETIIIKPLEQITVIRNNEKLTILGKDLLNTDILKF